MTEPTKKKKTLRFVRPAEMLQFANIVCDPPLGQSTVVPYGKKAVTFTVLIESSESFPETPWEVILWHSGIGDGQWQESALHDVTPTTALLAINLENRPKVYRRHFILEFPRPADVEHPVKFTIKYRTTAAKNWKWANEYLSNRDGELCFQTGSPPKDLANYLRKYSSDLKVRSVPSECPGAQLWSITASVNPAKGEDSGYSDISLGTPRSYTRWFAEVRTWIPWLAPRHGEEPFNVPQGAVMCSFLRWDGLHLVLLAVSGIKDILTEFNPDGNGNVILHARNDREETGTANVIAAVATEFEVANAACMYHARTVVANSGQPLNEKVREAVEEESEKNKDVRAQWQENWYDGLTYCTWNALGQDLNEDKIYNALNILREQKIFVTNLIIDDNWQSLDAIEGKGGSQMDWGWSEFEANKKGFPKGLKHTATKIRKENPNIEHIAVWHAILGYWAAVSPKGKIAKDYKTRTVARDGGMSGEGEWCVVHEDDVNRMYDDFYKFLISCGVDSVKTDAQFMLDQLHSAPDRRALITAYQDAWTIAALRYFSIKAISCMSQFPQDLFHTQLPTKKPRFMVRNSDDFFPNVPSSHPQHIFTNAHNAVFTQHLNVLPDWDMFQTSHDYSGFHAAGRCVSGGPIYITDYPGQHNIDLIKQMTAQTTTDKTIVLRPTTFGRTVDVYTAYEEERLLKVGTYTGSQSTGTSIIALFNVSQRSLTELVNINAFPGIENNQEYIVRAHSTGEISDAITLDAATPVVSLEVEVKGYEILSAFPLHTIKSSSNSASTRTQGKQTIITDDTSTKSSKVAILGLIGKMTGAAAVLSSSVASSSSSSSSTLQRATQHSNSSNLAITVTLKALGVLGIFVSDIHKKTIAKDVLVLMQGKVIPVETVKMAKKESVLEIDVEEAWNRMGLERRWGNDVELTILVN